MLLMKYDSFFSSHSHPAFVLRSYRVFFIGGATIQIGRAQECCEGYICEPGNVKVTCTKKENVAMEDLRVCAAEVRPYTWALLARQSMDPPYHVLTMFSS